MRTFRAVPEAVARHRFVVHHRLREVLSAKRFWHMGNLTVRELPQAREMVVDRVVGLEVLAFQCRVVLSAVAEIA